MPAKSTKSPAPKRNISNIIDMTDSDDEDIETIFISQPIKKIKREVESTGPCKESNSDSNISILKHDEVMKEKRHVSEKLEELRAHLTDQTYTYGSKYLNGKNDQLVSKLENARTTMIHSLENSIKQLDEPLKVVIIGQHKSGKTEFINYLLKDSNMKLRIDTVENREHPQAVIYGEIETTKIEKDVLYHFYNFEWLKSINFIEIPEISNVKVKDLFKKDYIISADLVIFVVSATALNSERDKEIIEHLSGCGKSFKVCITNMDKVIQDNADIRTAVKQKITKDVHFISSINSNLKNIDIYTPVEVMNSIDWAKLKLVSPLHSSSLDLDGICENLRLLNNDVNTIFTELKKIMTFLSTYYQRHKLSTSKTDTFSYYRIDKEFNDMISRVNEFYEFGYFSVVWYGWKAEKTLFKKSVIEEINHLMNSINGKLENDWKQHTSSKFEIEFPNHNQNYSGTVEFFKEELNDFSFPWSSNKFSKKLTKLNEDLKQSLHQALEKRMSCFINFDTTPIFQYFQEATDMLKDQYEKLSTLNGDFKNMARSISCMPTTSN